MTDTAVQLTIRALAALALLTACSTSPNQTSTGHSSTPTRPSTNMTTRTVVQVPPEATQHTEAGARAFARHYTMQMDQATQAADSSTLRSLSEPTCSGCQVGIHLADQLKSERQHHQALTFHLMGDRVAPGSTPDTVVVDVVVDDSGSTTVDASGTVVARSAAATLTFRQSVGWQSDRWRLVQSVLLQ